MSIVIGVSTFVAIIFVLVLLHEFGHYLVARFFKIKVHEFGIGFPPRLAGFWTGRTEFVYTPSTEVDTDDTKSDLNPPPPNTWSLRDLARTRQVVSVLHVSREDGRQEARRVVVGKWTQADGEQTHRIETGQIAEEREAPDGTRTFTLKSMLWSLNWLPFGGFVRLSGEDDPDEPQSLAAAPAGARFAVLVAGVAVNVALAFVLFTIHAMIPHDEEVGDVTVNSVFPGSPAHEAGIRPLFRILEVDGKQIEHMGDVILAITESLGETTEWTVQPGYPDPFAGPTDPTVHYRDDDLIRLNVESRWDPPRWEVVDDVTDSDSQMSLRVARGFVPWVGLSNSLVVVPQGEADDTLSEVGLVDVRQFLPDASVGDRVDVVLGASRAGRLSYLDARTLDARLGSETHVQEGATGVNLGMANDRRVTRSEPLPGALADAGRSLVGLPVATGKSIWGMASGSKNPAFDGPAFVGPVGMAEITTTLTTGGTSDFWSRVSALLFWAALISLSLAVLNFLPIPGLDGGRMLVVVIEAIRGGKPLNQRVVGMVHFAGFMVLIALMGLVVLMDVFRLLRGESLF